MKKTIILCLAFLMVFALLAAGCASGGGVVPPSISPNPAELDLTPTESPKMSPARIDGSDLMPNNTPAQTDMIKQTQTPK